MRETTDYEERVTFKWKSGGEAKSVWCGFGELTVNDDHTQVDVTSVPIIEEPVDGNVFDIVVTTRGSDPAGELVEIEYKNIPWEYV